MKITIALLLTAGLAQWNGIALSTSSSAPVWRVLLIVALALAAYALGRTSTNTYDRWTLCAAAVLSLPWAFVNVADWVMGLINLGVVVALPWLGGRFRHAQAELVAAGLDRVRHLERERELVAAEARTRERERIAADMHDSLGHELALIALRAGLLELSPDLDDRNRSAVTELRAAAGTATEQLRLTIGLLREDAPPTTPADETVEDLLERAVDAGLAVTFTRHGYADLPRNASRAVHRVVQEALTNAAKHAPGMPVDVRINHSAATTDVSVRNGLGPSTGDGGGHGLIGLAERVRLAGGTFHAGPDDGYFTVTATLPHTEGAP